MTDTDHTDPRRRHLHAVGAAIRNETPPAAEELPDKALGAADVILDELEIPAGASPEWLRYVIAYGWLHGWYAAGEMAKATVREWVESIS